MIINSGNLAAVRTGFKTAFGTGFSGVNPEWQRLATLVTSTTGEEKYGWLGSFPTLREWVGDRQLQNLAAHDYTIKNKSFEGTVEVPRDTLEDDQYGVYAPVFQSLGQAAATHPDRLVFGLLGAGFNTPCYDGKNFFDAHKVGKNTVSNVQTGVAKPWYLLDASQPLKPLIYQKRKEYKLVSLDDERDQNVFLRNRYIFGVDGRANAGYGFWQMAYGSKATLDAGNFAAALEAMMAFKDENGAPLGIKPTLLVVGPGNRSAALEIVEAERNAGGATNINKGAVAVLISPWLE